MNEYLAETLNGIRNPPGNGGNTVLSLDRLTNVLRFIVLLILMVDVCFFGALLVRLSDATVLDFWRNHPRPDLKILFSVANVFFMAVSGFSLMALLRVDQELIVYFCVFRISMLFIAFGGETMNQPGRSLGDLGKFWLVWSCVVAAAYYLRIVGMNGIIQRLRRAISSLSR